MQVKIGEVLNGIDPVLCEVMLTIEQPFAPKSSSKKLPNGKIISRPLEDLAPFLSKEELLTNMLIETIEE
jgi:acetolactate synthase-1/2/3 large subunit